MTRSKSEIRKPALFSALLALNTLSVVPTVAGVFSTPEAPACTLTLQRAALGNDQYMVSVLGLCEQEALRPLQVTVSDGKNLRVADCADTVLLSAKNNNLDPWLCEFPIRMDQSVRVQATIRGGDEPAVTSEIYRKTESFNSKPRLRILKGSRLAVSESLPGELRVLVQDQDVDWFSTGSNQVDLILKTPEGELVLESQSATAQTPMLIFSLNAKTLQPGANQLFFRVYDAYQTPNSAPTVDSEMITVKLENVGG